MSDCISFDILEEILTRIPDVKSLIQFRSVSKTWKSLIDSSRFITHHTHRKHHHHHHHIYLSYTTEGEHGALETHNVCILDNDSFPQHKVPLTIPSYYYPHFIGTSSHGLFCFRNINCYGKQLVVIWNPSIRKSITVHLPNMLDLPYDTVIGFGVCAHTLHFKLVKVSYIYNSRALESISCIPCQVEVFTRGAWRSPLCTNNLPRRTIAFYYGKDQIIVDGFIYWHAYDRIPDGRRPDLIISFDLTREEFTEIYLPDGLAHSILSISKLKESLVMLEHISVFDDLVYDVWKMEHGVSKTFSKLYTIITPGVSRVYGFRKSGEPIISILYADDRDNQIPTLYVYEPDSRNIKDLEISTLISHVICCSSYEETLLLLDY